VPNQSSGIDQKEAVTVEDLKKVKIRLNLFYEFVGKSRRGVELFQYFEK
jgi:hypothetical protein